MARNKSRRFHCDVVNEEVQIRLVRRRGRGFCAEALYFVQCDQADCQHVDENVPPCPLRLEMFADEMGQENAEE